MAPEVLERKKYNAAVDWWALGIIICQMASGDSPFYEGNDREKLISSIINDDPRIACWLDEDLKDLLRKPPVEYFMSTEGNPLSFLL
ncbi:hypothetical protein XENTR_v10005684 [Xenopus tropicalis]|nr:hypothetical protein XENTR_v10005684 [Xenopus tropicalis]